MPSTKSSPKPQPSWQFDAIGTQWAIETPNVLDVKTKTKVQQRIVEFDQTYSRFRDDSTVAKLAKAAGTYQFPDDAVDLIKLYFALYKATGRAVTPLVGDSLEAIGYDKNYSFVAKSTKPIEHWSKIMHWQGNTVTTTRPLTLDFGAVGKGYLVDQVARLLESDGVHEYVIDASGDILHRGQDIQRIGMENPFDPTMVIGVAEVRNKSICASATNRRRWGDGLHHVIDGRTGEPTNDVVATWAVADTTTLADGIATALFFSSADELKGVGVFEYVRLLANGRIEHSDGFVGQLFV